MAFGFRVVFIVYVCGKCFFRFCLRVYLNCFSSLMKAKNKREKQKQDG